MADNVTLSAGSADGAVIATDDDGTAQHQYVKLEFGADNTQTKVSSASPLPVQISDGTDTALVSAGGALHVAQQGTVTVDLGVNNDVTVTGTVDLGATDNAVLDSIAAGYAAEGAALGSGVLLQGDDGTDRTNVLVDTDGHLQVDVLTAPSTAVTNAGTFVVQENGAALTALQLVDDVVYVDDADWTDGASKHALVGGLYQSTPQTVTDGDVAPFNITANGALHVAQQGTVTISGTVDLGATDNGVLDAIAASVAAIDTDATTIIGHVDGIEGLLTTIDTDTGNIATSVATIAAAVSTEMQVDVVGALPAGTNNIGDVDVLSIAAGTNSIGNVGLVPRTSGGMTIFRSLDIDESEEEIKATAGQVFSITAFNTTAAPLYLKFYNATAANVSVGSTTPVLTFLVPGNADSDGAGFVWNNSIGFAFGTAITVACTTGVADNDTGAPGANACLVNVGYA